MQENSFGDEAPLLYSQGVDISSRNTLNLNSATQLTEEKENNESYPLWKLFVLTMCYTGLQYCWAIQIGHSTPYLVQCGLSETIVSLSWLAGPISGIVAQPFIGFISDRFVFPRIGRRRPWMLLGALFCVTQLIVFSNSTDLAKIFASPIRKLYGEKFGGQCEWLLAVSFGVLSFFGMDFSINFVQGPVRSLLVDTVPTKYHTLGNSLFSLFNGLGNSLGYFMGSIDYLKRFSEIQSFCRTQVQNLLFVSGSRPILYIMFFPIIVFFKVIDTSIDSLLESGKSIELTLFHIFGVKEIGKLTNIKIIFMSGAVFMITLTIISSVLVGENYHTKKSEKTDKNEEKTDELPEILSKSEKKSNSSKKSKRNSKKIEKTSKIVKISNKILEKLKNYWKKFKTDSMVFFDKIIHTPHSLIQAFFVQFFTFQATFFLFVYSTTWFGTQVYRGNPGGTDAEKAAYDEGVRFGNTALAWSSLISVVYAAALPFLVKKKFWKGLIKCECFNFILRRKKTPNFQNYNFSTNSNFKENSEKNAKNKNKKLVLRILSSVQIISKPHLLHFFWLFSEIIQALCHFSLIFIYSDILAFIVFLLFGLSQATMMSLPWAICSASVREYEAKKELEMVYAQIKAEIEEEGGWNSIGQMKEEEEIERRVAERMRSMDSKKDSGDQGLYSSMFNLSQCFPEIIVSLLGVVLVPVFVNALGLPMGSVLAVGGIFAFIAAILVCFVEIPESLK